MIFISVFRMITVGNLQMKARFLLIFVLYFLQRNNILQGGLPGYYHPDSKAAQIFALLDEDKGDEARRLLLSETYRQVHDYNMVAQLESPGDTVSVWSGGTDSLSVLMYKARFQFKERVGCTNFCSEKDAWRDKYFPYHGVVLYEFPSDLESYLEEQLFGENIVGKSRCTVRIAREDIDMIRNNNEDFAMNRSYVDSLIESNPFTCPGIRSYDRELITIQSLFVMSCGEGFNWQCHSQLPDTMTIRSLRFILRAVVMGNSSHFVSMVLIDNQWLFYDGMGRYESGIRIPKIAGI
jgi:hypothetical protein